MQHTYFTSFKTSIATLKAPALFTFPFCYQPHPLAKIAAEELQEYLLNQQDFKHNFGLNPADNSSAIGKMFGVLVVENKAGEIGYIAACSGKLAGINNHKRLVPPVFDMLQKDSYFLQEEEILNAYNAALATCESNPQRQFLKNEIAALTAESTQEVATKKITNKSLKQERAQARLALSPDTPDYDRLQADFIKQSLRDKFELNQLVAHWNQRINEKTNALADLETEIQSLKNARKQKSAELQQYLFQQYYFLNKDLERKNIAQIFQEAIQQLPPAAAGECAAPKLLQYAFSNDLRPIAMAEFWWGQSFGAEVRQHKQYYPACKNKCEPILGHMLKGIPLDPNPLLINTAADIELPIFYEDEAILIINKPAEFLSVPGIYVKDSVYTRMKTYLPTSDSPLIVHRLDMSTSGILVIAKTKAAHKYLQQQFANRTVKKRYEALLAGRLQENEGFITLPLRVDLEDRPRQLVCYEHGKPARTAWEVIARRDDKTLVSFYPITGRTHQLRVHAAHHAGLNTPIYGDDLYGKVADRLYLHAAYIEFIHPITKESISFNIPAEF